MPDFIATKNFTAFSGLGIIRVHNDSVVTAFFTDKGKQGYTTKCEVRCDLKGRAFFRKCGTRYYLDEFLRTDIGVSK